jgi:hypothetical protein
VFTGDKIRSIRVYWDQATVLKQLEIVGPRGRGWPIADGTHQIELIIKTGMAHLFIANLHRSCPCRRTQNRARYRTHFPHSLVEKQQPTILREVSVIKADIPENPTPKAASNGRRTYSITNDADIEIQEARRLPRIGWQNSRNHFVLSEEGDVPLKEQSPVRLPRAGQAPRREFSFSNLAQAYKAQDAGRRKPREPTHFELDNGSRDHATIVEHPQSDGVVAPPRDLVGTDSDDTPRPKSTNRSNGHRETIFHDADTTPSKPVKPSIGGGTGGRAQETIFVELEEDANPFVQPKKQTITRRDQQAHFDFTDESPPSTPAPRNARHTSFQHFSIEGTPDPHESEYRARALQKKEVNHFRPDTIPHFNFTDSDDPSEVNPKKGNSEGMNKLLKGISRNWMVGNDSPAPKENQKSALPKKGLTPHFSFGANGPMKEAEKENGRTGQNETKK